MNIQEFCLRFGGHASNIRNVIRQWQLDEVDALLRTLCDQHDPLIGSAVIVGDALHGDGLLDQIPSELRDAFVNLMKEKADTYGEMRQILLEKIRDADGGFVSLDDSHVQGFISKLKGQIGENIFKSHVGAAAHLAESGSQEGWDIAVHQANGGYEYVQVKLYSNASDVVKHMRSVQGKVANGLDGWHGETVHHIDFAVPEDIADQVRHLAEKYPELHSMQVLPIPVSASAAGNFVKEGLSNVGPDELGHFFDELLFGAVTAGSLHAIVNGFLWYKGAKELNDAIASAAASTAISTTGIGMGLIAETMFHTVMLSSAVGIGSRFLLSRLARSRWSFAEFLEESIARANAQTEALEQLRWPQPAAAPA